MRRLPVLGYLGRLVAAGGAVLMIVSLFVPAFSFSDDETYWDIYRRMDIVMLGLGIAALLLLAASLFVLRDLTLLVVAVAGGAALSFFAQAFIEFNTDEQTGAFLAILGSGAMIVGATIALLPSLVGRSDDSLEPAFLAAATPPSVEPAPGWYADPSGESRLRYWDGKAWTEQTQE